MPKNSSKRRIQTASNDKSEPKLRLRSRKSAQEQEIDDQRSQLLAEILNVSTNLSIDESSSPKSARAAIQDHEALLDLIEELRRVESSLNPELPRRDEQSWAKFFEWIDTHSGDSDFEKVPPSSRIGVGVTQMSAPRLSDEEEYSLIVKEPIKSGETVFKVRRDLMLSTETASKDLDLNDFTRSDMIASGMQNVVLVLHLLNEHSKGERSHWWPYLSILPRKLLPILKLDKTQLSRHLLASAHIFEALKMLRAISRQYSYFYKRLQATKLPLKRHFTYLYYAWGVSVVCSRQNEIPPRARSRDQQVPPIHALIPLLDMCNHSLHSNQALFLGESSCLTAPSDLETGQEITINYGWRSSGDFYIHNGFVPEEVPGDALPLTIALPNDGLLEAKTKLLRILNMPKILGRFKLVCNSDVTRHRRDPHLTMFLIVYCLNEQELSLILSSSNLVGIADHIYDFIQYKLDQPNAEEKDQEPIVGSNHEESLEIDKMKLRLGDCYKSYLARRSSVCIALIDRTLNELTMDEHETLEEQSGDKLYAIRLLQREREIYESYLSAKIPC